MCANEVEGLVLKSYYAKFNSIVGAVAGLVSLLPLGAIIGPNAYLFPPLGGDSIEKFAIIGTVILSLSCTLFVYQKRKAFVSKLGLALLLSGAALCITIQIMLYTAFVRDVQIPSKNEVVTVSVGFARCPDNPSEYAKMSDEEMLKDAGPTESAIRHLFTLPSLLAVRALLYLSYLATILLVVMFASCAVLFSALDDLGRGKSSCPDARAEGTEGLSKQ